MSSHKSKAVIKNITVHGVKHTLLDPQQDSYMDMQKMQQVVKPLLDEIDKYKSYVIPGYEVMFNELKEENKKLKEELENKRKKEEESIK